MNLETICTTLWMARAAMIRRVVPIKSSQSPSGILSSMAAGNCLIVLDEERGDVAPGETVLVEPF